MKYIRRNFKLNKIILRKYTKNYQHNTKITTFLKSNYKYKRRCLRHTNRDKLFVQESLSQWLQRRNQKQNCKRKQQMPFVMVNTQIAMRNLFYNNTKLEKFLRIFISIMHQVELPPTTKNYVYSNKNVSNGLAIRLFGKMKTIKNFYTSPFLLYVKEDEIRKRHHAYKEANKATDNYTNIGSNIVDEISHQQHNYDKVSTITSTPIKCQRRKHHQIKSTKTSISSLSSSSLSPIAPTTSSVSTTIMTTSLSSPSMAVKTNYEIYQWPAILHNYICDSPSIHHQYHHKRKYNQLNHFHQQHQNQQQQHALHIKSLTSSSFLNDSSNNNSNTDSKNNSSSINSNKSSNSNFGNTDSPTCNRVAIVHQLNDQYVNTIWNRSYTLSCLLLTLFIVFTIGIRSTTAGACWQTILDNGKCNEIFSLNISKSECCGANQEFAYTEREPTNVEYFFATAIGGGMECLPCLESCKNVKCGPNKKCVKRKGRPKCICAPECGAARRRRKQQENLMQQEQQDQQHHTFHLISSIAKDISDTDNDDDDDDVTTATIQSSNAFKIKIDKSQQSRDTRSLSSEITNVNLGLESGKDEMMINGGSVTSQMVRHHSNNKEHNENQRKLIHRPMQQHSYPHNTKEPNDFQQYTHQIQQQQQHQLLELEQQQLKHKDQEPKDSRRLLITANVEHMEKPTTRRLQIFSNVRITHARRHNSNKNSNRNSNKNKNNNRNKHDQDEDTDPSDSVDDDDDDDDDEEYEENNYNDAEENDDDELAKRKYSNSDNNNKNNNRRNDDATRFLNESLPRHKLIKSSNNNGNNISSSSNNKKRKIKLKKNHDLQATKILQQHSSKNNTRIRHPQTKERQAEDTSHRRNHHNNNRHHRQQHHQQEQHQEHRNHHKHHQHRQNHHRHHGRQKHNKKQQQQNIVIKKPKNNRNNGNATIAAYAPTKLNASDDKEFASFPTLLQPKYIVNTSSAIVKITPLPNLSSPSSSPSLSSSKEVLTATTTTIITTSNKQSQSRLLFSSSTMSSSLSSTTPVNSTMSAINSITAANDHYRSDSPNHGSKIATSSSSSQSPSSTFSSSSQLSTSPTARSPFESSFIPTEYAGGEGVAQYDHQHRSIKIPSAKNSNNNNDNDDHLISTFNSNLHNNMLQKQQENLKQQQQQHQQDQQQTQAHQQYVHSSLLDAISDQIDLMRFPNKQQQHTITSTDNVRSLNPVCGTDGRTYNTECQLRKRACRTDNQNLQVAYRGHCRTTCNGVMCLNGLTCVEDQYSLPHCISCKIECLQDDYDNDVVDATKAVCGADGKTYKSVCDINRMICKIGRSIGVAYLGPCREEHISCDDINCGPKQVCLIDLLTHKPRCTSCRYKCSRKRNPSFTHFEEGKICGANNRTYNSWCEMRKDSCSTGFYIDLKYSGSCH